MSLYLRLTDETTGGRNDLIDSLLAIGSIILGGSMIGAAFGLWIVGSLWLYVGMTRR